jgi:membrane protease YdiL (CAAX protease family)
MIGLIASQAGGKAIAVDLGVGIALSGVVLLWAGVNRRDALVPLARVPHAGWFFAAIGLGVLTFAIAMGVMYLLRQLFQVPQGEMSDPYRQAGFGWGAVIVAIAVQPAVIEELAFRGIITSALLRALTPFEAIMVGALMFMILHLSPARFPHTLALGVAAGFLRVRTGSLYPCMLLHFTHNFLCVGVEWAGIG